MYYISLTVGGAIFSLSHRCIYAHMLTSPRVNLSAWEKDWTVVSSSTHTHTHHIYEYLWTCPHCSELREMRPHIHTHTHMHANAAYMLRQPSYICWYIISREVYFTGILCRFVPGVCRGKEEDDYAEIQSCTRRRSSQAVQLVGNNRQAASNQLSTIILLAG